ncbi:MAG: mechanosensitive ion channel family protein, partial [Cellvibrionaceae bacterium]|nr:mechanosensitive ion channel family protein [Cellvibrionaceae bacterium]
MLKSAVTMPNWLIELSGNKDAWIVEVFIVVTVTLLAALLARGLFNNLAKQALKSKNLWDDALVESIRRPVRWLIWLVGMCWAAEIAAQQSDFNLLAAIEPIRQVGVVL